MTKQNFISELRKGLSGLPKEDIEERIIFYTEMIDDRVEEGLTEEDAISEIGSVDKIISQIMSEIPFSKLVKEKVKTKQTLRAWEIVLLILGAPLWLSLLIAVAALVFSVYIVIWSVILSIYAIDFSFAVCGVAGIFSVIVCIPHCNITVASCYISASLVCAGISILLFFGCNQITKGVLLLTKNIHIAIKSCFIRKKDTK